MVPSTPTGSASSATKRTLASRLPEREAPLFNRGGPRQSFPGLPAPTRARPTPRFSLGPRVSAAPLTSSQPALSTATASPANLTSASEPKPVDAAPHRVPNSSKKPIEIFELSSGDDEPAAPLSASWQIATVKKEPSPDPTSEDEVLASALAHGSSSEMAPASQRQGAGPVSDSESESGSARQMEDDELKSSSPASGSSSRLPLSPLQASDTSEPSHGKTPGTPSVDPRTEEDDEEEDDLYDIPPDYVGPKSAASSTSAPPISNPVSTHAAASPVSAKQSVAPQSPHTPHTTPPPPVPRRSSDDDDDDDDDGSDPPNPISLFSQSNRIAASQSQRKLAEQALAEFQDSEGQDQTEAEEDEGKPFDGEGVKVKAHEQSVDYSAFFSSSAALAEEARKRMPSPEYNIVLDSSSDEPSVPQKRTLKRTRDDTQTPKKEHSKKPRNDASPSKKREVPIHEFKRDQDLWLLDGSVIIHIEDTGFRLHESTLSLQFGYFKDLFHSRPHPTRIIDKTPVYRVEGSASDFRELYLYLLSMKHYRVSLPQDQKAEDTFRLLAPIARAAERFRMSVITEHLHQLFGQFYPAEKPGSAGHTFSPEAVALVEDCPSLDFLLKPAMYDLLCQPSLSFGRPQRGHRKRSANLDEVKRPLINVSEKRLLQLLTARSALQEQWLIICSTDSCLIARGTEPSNRCKCHELFPDEAISGGDLNLSEEEKREREARREQRMLAVWTRVLYLPPSSSVSRANTPDEEGGEGSPVNTEPKGAGSGARTASRKGSKTAANEPTLMSIGHSDIMRGLDILLEENWEDLECGSCLKRRERKWKKKQTAIWEMLDGYFEDEDDEDD